MNLSTGDANGWELSNELGSDVAEDDAVHTPEPGPVPGRGLDVSAMGELLRWAVRQFCLRNIGDRGRDSPRHGGDSGRATPHPEIALIQANLNGTAEIALIFAIDHIVVKNCWISLKINVT
jgi:hypothetical protein